MGHLSNFSPKMENKYQELDKETMAFKEIKTFGQEFKSKLRNYINFKDSTTSDDPFNKNESIESEKSA